MLSHTESFENKSLYIDFNPNGTGFAELYRQRLDLYREYADVRIDCTGKGPKEIAREIFDQIEQQSY